MTAVDSGGLQKNKDPFNVNEVYNDCPRHEPPRPGESDERFLFGWTNAGGGPNSTTHNLFHKDVFFAHFHPASLSFTNAAGKDLGAFVGFENFEDCLVYDTGNHSLSKPHIVDYYFVPSSVDSSGRPIMAFKYDGDLVIASSIAENWNYTVVDRNLPSAMFDMERMSDGRFRLFHVNAGISVYESALGGWTDWTQTQKWEPPQGGRVGKVLVIPSGHRDFQLLAMENDWGERSYKGKYRVWAIGQIPLRMMTQKTASLRWRRIMKTCLSSIVPLLLIGVALLFACRHRRGCTPMKCVDRDDDDDEHNDMERHEPPYREKKQRFSVSAYIRGKKSVSTSEPLPCRYEHDGSVLNSR